MKKVVLKLDFDDDKIKQKAMQKVSGLSGVESIALDPKDKKLTVTGDIDPVTIVSKLRKLCHTEIVSVGPAKEPEKKKAEPKKEENKKKDGPKEDSAHFPKAYPAAQYPYYYNQPPYQPYQQHIPTVGQPPLAYFSGRSVEENPNSCVIC